MTKLLIQSEQLASTVNPQIVDPFLWIQIKTNDNASWFKAPSMCRAKLNLAFNDTDTESDNSFTLDQAKQVVNFLDEHLDSTIIWLVINCEAGISRSAGLAVGIDEAVFHHQPSSIIYQKPLFNRLVCRKFKEAYLNV